MCAFLIPGLIIGGVALASTQMNRGPVACEPVCPPQQVAYAPAPPPRMAFREKTSRDDAPRMRYEPMASYTYAPAVAAPTRASAGATRGYGSPSGSRYTYPVYGAANTYSAPDHTTYGASY